MLKGFLGIMTAALLTQSVAGIPLTHSGRTAFLSSSQISVGSDALPETENRPAPIVAGMFLAFSGVGIYLLLGEDNIDR